MASNTTTDTTSRATGTPTSPPRGVLKTLNTNTVLTNNETSISSSVHLLSPPPSPIGVQKKKKKKTLTPPRSSSNNKTHGIIIKESTITRTPLSSSLLSDINTEDTYLFFEDEDFCDCDFDDDVSSHNSSIEGWSVDEFEYIRTLGKGGTATVFLVREKQSGTLLALKVQPKLDDDGEDNGDSSNDDDDDGFCGEIDIHLALDHPSIVKMIDYFHSDKKPFPEVGWEESSECDVDDVVNEEEHRGYLCMIVEYCDGGSLFDVLGTSADCLLQEKHAASYFRSAVNALQYVHDQNIIHCDIKSMNFLVSTTTTTTTTTSTNDNKNNNGHSGTAAAGGDGGQHQLLKLADFGMAVFDDAREVVGGSPMFMSPEHLLAWRHFTDEFDHRTDIYSLGVVLFEMLVGYLPYEVIEDKDGEDSSLSLTGEFEKKLSISSGDDDDFDSDFGLPVLDLRRLEDATSDEPFYVPPPIFPDFVSEEAQDLIMHLMEPSPDKRISLTEVKEHPWLKKYQQ